MVMFRAIIVDDHAFFRTSLREVLASRFPDSVIEEAADGRIALEKIEEDPPDLVFMDIQLPGENGLEITRRIKKHHPGMRVIILTSYDLPEYREAASKLGASAFLTKGTTNPQEIASVVASLLADAARS
jgi:DNA-binding NarL/FixJ family response regulator